MENFTICHAEYETQMQLLQEQHQTKTAPLVLRIEQLQREREELEEKVKKWTERLNVTVGSLVSAQDELDVHGQDFRDAKDSHQASMRNAFTKILNGSNDDSAIHQTTHTQLPLWPVGWVYEDRPDWVTEDIPPTETILVTNKSSNIADMLKPYKKRKTRDVESGSERDESTEEIPENANTASTQETSSSSSDSSAAAAMCRVVARPRHLPFSYIAQNRAKFVRLSRGSKMWSDFMLTLGNKFGGMSRLVAAFQIQNYEHLRQYEMYLDRVCCDMKLVQTGSITAATTSHNSSLSNHPRTGEVFPCFHGTSRASLQSIAVHGLDYQLAPKRLRHAYGIGSYVARKLSKALTYADNSAGVKFVVVLRAAVGLTELGSAAMFGPSLFRGALTDTRSAITTSDATRTVCSSATLPSVLRYHSATDSLHSPEQYILWKAVQSLPVAVLCFKA